MKKFIVLSAIGLLMAFAVTVQAQQLEFKASGFIDAQSLWYVNATPGWSGGPIYNSWMQGNYDYGRPIITLKPNYPRSTPGKNVALDKKVAFMESRARLKFDAIMGKELSGTFFFEFDTQPWGNTPGGNGDLLSERNTYGFWSADRAALEIKNIYIDVGLPYFGIPVPMAFRIGSQPFSIRPNVFQYTDGMGIIGKITVDPVVIQPMWGKPWEGDINSADDVDVYGLEAYANISGFKLGGYFQYWNMSTYPLYMSSNVGGVSGLPASLKSALAGTFKADMWWLGLYADGKAGPVNLNFDFIYDHGKVKEVYTPGVDDVKYNGWMSRLKIDFPWEAFNFGVVGMYATGANTEKSSPSGYPGSVTPQGLVSYKNSSFVVPIGSEAGNILNESIVFYATDITRGDSGIACTNNYQAMTRGGTGGTWFAKLYGSYKAAPWYKVTLQGLYIGDTTKNGNTFGTAVSGTHRCGHQEGCPEEQRRHRLGV